MCGIRTHILGASRGLQRVTFLKLVYCLDRMIIFGNLGDHLKTGQ